MIVNTFRGFVYLLRDVTLKNTWKIIAYILKEQNKNVYVVKCVFWYMMVIKTVVLGLR
jgi:hypothetical protein